MNLSTRMIVVLTSVGLLSGLFLASVGISTKTRIALNKQIEIEKAVFSVVPGTYSSQKLYQEKDLSIYGGMDEKGNLLGYAIHASTVGFQDKITFMLGINPLVTRIISLSVLEQKETPGLGEKITDRKSFLVFWESRDCIIPLSLRKPPVSSPDDLSPSEVNTITGATISSEAVLNAVNSSLVKVKKLKEEGKLRVEKENAR